MAVTEALTAVTGVLGTGGFAALIFGRRMQKAQTESVLVQASSEFVQSVSEQMQRMEERMKNLENAERRCQEALRVTRLKLIKLEESIHGDGK